MWINMFAALPDDILGHILTMCDLKLCFRASLACKHFREGFVWSNIKNIDLYLTKNDPESMIMFHSLLQHLPLLSHVATLSLVCPDWPLSAELAQDLPRFIRALSPTLKQIKLALLGKVEIAAQEFFSHCTPSILEKLDISGDYLDYVVKIPSLPRLRAVSLYASSPERFSTLLEALASKTGALELCQFEYRMFFNREVTEDDQGFSTPMRKLTGANQHIGAVWLKPERFHPNYYALANLFGFETTQGYLPPEKWHLIPEKIRATWGLAPLQCRIGPRELENSFWEYIFLHSLKKVIVAAESFALDSEMLDFLHDQLVPPTSENQGLVRLINIILDPCTNNHASIEPLLRWAEHRVLQLLPKRNWSAMFLAEALMVLGVRLILPDQKVESIEASKNHCRQILSQIEHPFNLMKFYRTDALGTGALFRAILDCGNWCPLVEPVTINLPVQTTHYMTNEAAPLRAFLFHPTFQSHPNARMHNGNNQLVAETLLVAYLDSLSLALTRVVDSRLARDCLDQLFRICLENHVIVACPTKLSYGLVMLLWHNAELSRQFAHVIDSPLRLFQAFRCSTDQFTQRTLGLLKVVLETFDRERADVAAAAKQAIRQQCAEAIWRAIFANENLLRVSFEEFVKFIEPAVSMFGALPFLAEFATNPSASSCIGIDFGIKEANVFKQGIILCFSKVLGLGLMV